MMPLALALAISASWWGAHGVTVPCHPSVEIVTPAQMSALGVDGAQSAAWPATYRCEILLTPIVTSTPESECAMTMHEFGNLAGIPETDGKHRVTDQWWDFTAYSCTHWRLWRRSHWGY